ncbi:MAG: hypothetical protein RJA70_3100 [Pseudomonadota bacterium]|jgi:uncharacterized protein YdcH (DUF465 family)
MEATGNRLTKLTQLHRRLEDELKALLKRGRMTPSEQVRATVIKKEKLRAKDEILGLVPGATPAE